jgi:hypothetical protein
MSQQAADLPRFVQIIGRHRTLVGIMAVLGLLAGVVFAALTPSVFTSKALVLVGQPTCPVGSICGGPAFSSGYIQSRLQSASPDGVQIKPVTGNVVSVVASAGTVVKAEAALDGYLGIVGMSAPTSMSYQGEQVPVRLLEPPTAATGTAPAPRLLSGTLLGAAFGALLGIIVALAGSRTTIDPLTAPQGFGAGEEAKAVGRGTGYAPTGVWLQQLAREHVERKTALDASLGRSQADPHEDY